MSPESRHDDTREINQSLWLLTASPTIFAVHFLLSYITAAVWCAKLAGPYGSLWTVRLAVAIYTMLAVLGIGVVGWDGYRRHRYGWATVPHDFDTPEDRHRFLGFAILLLSGLSLVAVVYVVLAVVFIGDCR